MNRHIWIVTPLLVGLGLCAAPAAAPAQEFLGKPMGKWQADLSSPNAKVRRGGAFALGKIGTDAGTAVTPLVKVLKADPDPKVQEAAAYALGEICQGGKNMTVDARDALCAALSGNPDAAVKRSAAVALGNIALTHPAILAALKGQAGNPDPGVRQNVAYALGKVDDDNTDTLRQLLKDDDVQVKLNAAKAIGEYTSERAAPAVPELLACCNDPDGELKRAAMLSVVRLVGPKSKDAVPVLVKALDEKDQEVRRNAALALGNIGGEAGKAAVPVLREFLRDEDATVRRQGVVALRNIGENAKDAVDDLRLTLKDKDKDVRLFTATAFSALKLHGARAVPDLIERVADKNEDADVRAESAVALSRFTPPVPAAATPAAVSALVRVIEDEANPIKVRERTLWALAVHQRKLADYKDAYPAMTKLLTSTTGVETKMLRYNSAYFLGLFQADKAPDAVLNVLFDFLKDDKIQIYAGNTGKTVGKSIEGGKQGGSDVKEQRIGDGRVMAVQALDFVGKTRLQQRPEIITQLRTIANDPALYQKLRDDANDLLKKLK
jgi:HEAT repeat protein